MRWDTCRGYVAIRPHEGETSVKGIVLPETRADGDTREGTVIAISRPWRDRDGNLHTPTLRVGMRVIYATQNARRNRLTIGTVDLVPEKDVLLAAHSEEENGGAVDTAAPPDPREVRGTRGQDFPV